MERTRTVLAAGVELCAAAAGCRLFDWALHNPYCGLLFRCHCTWPWAGGSAHCNVHHATGPKCPWCNVRNTPLHWLAWAIKDNFTVSAMVLAYVITWLAQTVAVGPSASPLLPKGGLVARPSVCLPILTRATAAMLTFALLGFVLGLVFYLGTDYPCNAQLTSGSAFNAAAAAFSSSCAASRVAVASSMYARAAARACLGAANASPACFRICCCLYSCSRLHTHAHAHHQT